MVGHRDKLLIDRLQLLDDFFLHGIGVDFTRGATGSKIRSRPFAGNRGDG